MARTTKDKKTAWSNRTPADRANLDDAVRKLLSTTPALRGQVHHRFVAKHGEEGAPDDRMIGDSLKRLARDGKCVRMGKHNLTKYAKSVTSTPADTNATTTNPASDAAKETA
jgi:hypothetical protein